LFFCQVKDTINVYSVNINNSPPITSKTTYSLTSNYQRGLMLVGGYYTTGIYTFDTNIAPTVKYASFTDASLNNLPSSLSFNTTNVVLTSYPAADANIYSLSACGYGNELYYNTAYNSAGSSIRKISMGGFAEVTSISVSGLSWYAAVLNWVTTTATSVDIYQCVDASYTILSGTKIASNVSNDYGSTTTGSYLLNNLDASRTYYYALTITGQINVQKTLSITTLVQPIFGGTGGTSAAVTNLSTFDNTGFASPAINGANSKMLLTKTTGMYYSTSSNNGTTWTTPVIIQNTPNVEILQMSLSYKGDIGIALSTSSGNKIYSILWNSTAPVITNTYSLNSSIYVMISLTMDGLFALYSCYAPNALYYARWNFTNNYFDVNTTSLLSTCIAFGSCFTPSSTYFVGQPLNGGIVVLQVNTITPSVSVVKTYTNAQGNPRGVILVGGKQTTGMYTFQNNNTVQYAAFNETNIPNTLSFTSTNILSNFTNPEANALTISACGYGNILYYNKARNTAGSGIYSLPLYAVPSVTSISVSGVSWNVAVLNWVTSVSLSVDIYQCEDASYTILSGTKIASNVSNDYGSSSTGSYLLNNLDASRTYYYALTLSGEINVQKTLSVTTLYEPAFGVAGGTNGTSIISYPYTGYGSPVINGANTKMLFYTGPSDPSPSTRLKILYTSRASTSDQWSTPLPIPGLSLPALISTGSMSYKGDYAMILMDLIYPARTEASIYIIYWNGNIPSYSKQDLSYCTMVNMTMDGTFALASNRVTGKVYYSKLNLITNQFSTFTYTDLSLNPGIAYAGCFNSSGTIYVGTCENKTIKVLNVNTSTSSVTLYATYTVSQMSDGTNSRGLILVGGKTSRGIYLFQNSVKPYYLPFDETSLPVSGSSLPAITTNILNNWPIGDLTQVTNSSFINNILYYNNGFNTSGSTITPLRVGDVPSISSFTASGVSWYAALLNWVSNGTTSVDIYQCVDASYTILSGTKIASNVSNDYGSTTTGSYLLNNLDASRTYYYAITIYNQTTKLQTLSFTTSSQPIFGGVGSSSSNVFTLEYTSYSSPAVNGLYNKMLVSTKSPSRLYYSTSTNNGGSWAAPVSFFTPSGEINMKQLSYKGDIGLILDYNNDNTKIYTINWNSTIPTYTLIQTLSTCSMISMTMDGLFALASVYSTGKLYYSKSNKTTKTFNTFTDTGVDLGTNLGYSWNGCFNTSATLFIGQCYNSNLIKVVKIDTNALTFSIIKTYNVTMYTQRGLICVGGYNTTGIYMWQGTSSTSYASFNDISVNNLQNDLSFSNINILTNFPTNGANNMFNQSACGYGNTLYYNTAYSSQGSSIKKIELSVSIQLSVSGVNWYAAVLNWVTSVSMSVDIYQCTNSSYNIGTGTKIASNVSNDYGSTSTGSYLLNNLNSSTTYYYAITIYNQTTKQQTLSFTTLAQPSFQGNGTNVTQILSNIQLVYASPAVNAAYTKMLYATPTSLNYCTSTNGGITWTNKGVVPGAGTTGVVQLSLSYKGDIGFYYDNSSNLYTVNWSGSDPSVSLIQNITSINMTCMNMNGTLAVIGSFQSPKFHFSTLDTSTQKFKTFTDTGLRVTLSDITNAIPQFTWGGCFNPSSTKFIGLDHTERNGYYHICVISIENPNSSTPTFTFTKSYRYSYWGYERGLIMFGGYSTSLAKYNTTRIYVWNAKTVVKYVDLDEDNLPAQNTILSFTGCLSNVETTIDTNILTISSTGYGNYLYYYSPINSTTCHLNRIQMF
jgi:hypothetical protein